MGYKKINNLYQDQTVLMFKEVWATEKIHGTSAWVTYEHEKLQFHSGGAKLADFVAIFDQAELLEKMKERFGSKRVRLHGEHYGGPKIQAMSHIYGDMNRFALFEVKIDDFWLSFDKVQKLGAGLGLDVVHGVVVPATLEALDAERDAPSVQAVRNGVGDDLSREGIVIRPLIELTRNNGERVIAKYKGEAFRETKRPRPVVDPAQLEKLNEAEAIAEEWVTPMRLAHVLDKFPDAEIKQTGAIIKAMLADIEAEAVGEIEWSSEARKAIGTATAKLFKAHLKQKLEG